ncbi:hypothetical protein CEXT_763261 [Caerostris extrusa]|uniref:Uncharacterized protein n=1 Tax=Caerostris extrusa TaxID=172846 RepID=A0AAV4XT23_CAEEX|nr:hypothetical protein CEXT_763261 [Caerostris extrusa]
MPKKTPVPSGKKLCRDFSCCRGQPSSLSPAISVVPPLCPLRHKIPGLQQHLFPIKRNKADEFVIPNKILTAKPGPAKEDRRNSSNSTSNSYEHLDKFDDTNIDTSDVHPFCYSFKSRQNANLH